MRHAPRLWLGALLGGLVVGAGGCGEATHRATATTDATVRLAAPGAQPHASLAPDPGADNEGSRHPRRVAPLAVRSFAVSLSAAPSARHTSATVILRPGARALCWRVGALPGPTIASAAFGRVRAHTAAIATIRQGASGRRGPVVVAFGARYVARGCAGVPAIVINSIASAPRNYYLSVVVSGNAPLRGQLARG